MFQALKHSMLGDALPCYVISRRPLILVSYWQDFFNEREAFAAACRQLEEPVHVLAMLGWHRETPERAAALRGEVTRLAKLAPAFRPVFLANSPAEQALIEQQQLRAVFCHQNAFLDEHRYRILPHARKRFDAIYVARITPFKRHELAADIRSLRLIGAHHAYEQDYRDDVMRQLRHASWREKAWSAGMYRQMNAARTGLCLSAEEGAMFVSAEYLLCGLPVISTPNLGGRDQLFTAPFALSVAPDPKAVAEGVAEQIARRHDPREIRAAVLERMHAHRAVFASLVQTLYDERGVDRCFADEWPAVYRHKLGIRCRVPPLTRRRRGILRPDHQRPLHLDAVLP